MTVSLKKYLWQFSGLYLLCFIFALVAAFFIHQFWGLKLQDFIIILALSSSLPMYTAEKFTKDQGRFLNETEQKILVKKMSLIALAISILPTAIYFSYVILLKALFSPQDISSVLTKEHVDKGYIDLIQTNNFFLMAIILGTGLLFYVIIRFSINGTFKRMGKQYQKKMNKI